MSKLTSDSTDSQPPQQPGQMRQELSGPGAPSKSASPNEHTEGQNYSTETNNASGILNGDEEIQQEKQNGNQNGTNEQNESGESEDEAQEERDESQFLADLPDDTEDLDLTHCRLTDMKALGFGRFSKLSRLGLRQNLFTRIEGLDGLSEVLVELDLYDNRISKFDNLKKLKKLESLDLSFNKIKYILPDVLVHLPFIRDLYFVANKISKIENLDGLDSLKNLEFGANRVKKIENLNHLVNLEQLWLGKNKIERLENFSGLRNLKILSIQSNRITKLENLEVLENLEELYISHNGISKIEGLESNTKLRVLDVASNRIEKLEGLSHLSQLEEFWGNHNQFSDWEDVEKQLGGIKTLETVYLEGNPLQKQNEVMYRYKVKLSIPGIKQIDATYVQA
ncbi:hypothetical protein BKA69DRAFT_1109592 [Paraphysoderma sedebokerense]|nr:hypothetical protein BKA69DRAFT_1109592 [Paraphysoderma sedebokerense]